RERRALGRVAVELHHERAEFPLAADLDAATTNQEAILVHGRTARTKLVFRLFVVLELRLHVPGDHDVAKLVELGFRRGRWCWSRWGRCRRSRRRERWRGCR